MNLCERHYDRSRVIHRALGRKLTVKWGGLDSPRGFYFCNKELSPPGPNLGQEVLSELLVFDNACARKEEHIDITFHAQGKRNIMTSRFMRKERGRHWHHVSCARKKKHYDITLHAQGRRKTLTSRFLHKERGTQWHHVSCARKKEHNDITFLAQGKRSTMTSHFKRKESGIQWHNFSWARKDEHKDITFLDGEDLTGGCFWNQRIVR